MCVCGGGGGGGGGEGGGHLTNSQKIHMILICQIIRQKLFQTPASLHPNVIS